jgi:excisionase family DNA binding protein
MVTADEAATVTSVGTRTIYRWVEEGKIHFTEEPEGSLLICLNSLS